MSKMIFRPMTPDVFYSNKLTLDNGLDYWVVIRVRRQLPGAAWRYHTTMTVCVPNLVAPDARAAALEEYGLSMTTDASLVVAMYWAGLGTDVWHANGDNFKDEYREAKRAAAILCTPGTVKAFLGMWDNE